MVAIFGRLFRYILNINTIWGVMIIISFLAAALQHFMPTTSWISPEQLKSGENQVVIQVVDKDEETLSATYAVAFDGTELSIVEKLSPEAEDDFAPVIYFTQSSGWNARLGLGLRKIWILHDSGK